MILLSNLGEKQTFHESKIFECRCEPWKFTQNALFIKYGRGNDNMAAANNYSENTVGLLKSEQLNNCQKIPFFWKWSG